MSDITYKIIDETGLNVASVTGNRDALTLSEALRYFEVYNEGGYSLKAGNTILINKGE